MASTKGKLEGRITVSSWDVKIDEGGGDVTVSLTDGDYYLSSSDSNSNDLLAQLAADLNGNGSLSNTYSCSIAAGEGGTGKVTLSADAGFAVTWSTTALRDVLGFENDGDLSSATSHESSASARSLWLPTGSPAQSLNGNDSSWSGGQVSDKRTSVSDAGYANSQAGRKRTEREVVWPAVPRERTWIVNESTANQSCEKFWQDVIRGDASWSSRPAGPFRYYRDADTDANYVTYVAVAWSEFAPSQMVANWTGRWQIAPGRWVEVP